MNIPSHHFNRRPRGARRDEGGMATIVFIALLAIMMILVTAESRALFQLRHEVRFIQQQQIKRLNNQPTNNVAPPTTASP